MAAWNKSWLVVGLAPPKLNPSNHFRVALNNHMHALSNFTHQLFKKTITTYTTKYNNYQYFQLCGIGKD